MTKEQSIIEHITRRAFIVEQALHGDIVEQAIRGDGGKRSVREAITWAMEQGYLHGKESGIAAEREACARLCEQPDVGYKEAHYAMADYLASAIRARSEK